MAEEILLTMLLKEPGLLPEAKLPPETFSSPLLGRAFALLWQAKAEGRIVSVASLAGQFTPEESSHLSAICQQPESTQNAAQALEDYIRIIHTEANKRAGIGSADPLLAATEKYKKGTGGKHNG